MEKSNILLQEILESKWSTKDTSLSWQWWFLWLGTHNLRWWNYDKD